MESYKCIALSTAHITERDAGILSSLSSEMIMIRKTGFFIKLYEELEHNHFSSLSIATNKMIEHCHQNGARLIELDRDAQINYDLAIFDW